MANVNETLRITGAVLSVIVVVFVVWVSVKLYQPLMNQLGPVKLALFVLGFLGAAGALAYGLTALDRRWNE